MKRQSFFSIKLTASAALLILDLHDCFMQCLGQVTKLCEVCWRFNKRLLAEGKLENRNHNTLWLENRGQIIDLPASDFGFFYKRRVLDRI
jgi:hypothetical protein